LEESKTGRNRIVVRYKDGKLRKGYTHDFTPVSQIFHLIDEAGNIHDIDCKDLKAVFFVRSLVGNRDYNEKKRFEEVDCTGLRGLKIKVTFMDGEVLRGMTLSYNKERKGFYIVPIDPETNNERIFVIADATKDVKVGPGAEK
jgi:hypothetical protein